MKGASDGKPTHVDLAPRLPDIIIGIFDRVLGQQRAMTKEVAFAACALEAFIEYVMESLEGVRALERRVRINCYVDAGKDIKLG